MTLVFSIAIAFLFGAGAYLALKPDLLRMVVGMLLVSQASVLTVMAAGLVRGRSPWTASRPAIRCRRRWP